MPRYVSAPPTRAEGIELPPVRASGATFVVVGPGPATGSPRTPLPPPEDGSVGPPPPATVVAVVLDVSDEEDDDDDDDDDDDEDDVDVVELVVVVLPVDTAQVSPLGSLPLALKVNTTFQNLSPSPVVVAHARPTL